MFTFRNLGCELIIPSISVDYYKLVEANIDRLTGLFRLKLLDFVLLSKHEPSDG